MLLAMARIAPPSEVGIQDVFMFILMFLGVLREDEVTRLGFADVWVGHLDDVLDEVLFVCVR